MPKDGSHKGYSLFPSVCSDSCLVSRVLVRVGRKKQKLMRLYFLYTVV